VAAVLWSLNSNLTDMLTSTLFKTSIFVKMVKKIKVELQASLAGVMEYLFAAFFAAVITRKIIHDLHVIGHQYSRINNIAYKLTYNYNSHVKNKRNNHKHTTYMSTSVRFEFKLHSAAATCHRSHACLNLVRRCFDQVSNQVRFRIEHTF
jgi:hypothetical protein